jgi:hypothetical protein
MLIVRTIVISILAFMAYGCFPECEVGDTQACNCPTGGYINYCTPEGEFPDCQCYDNNGNPLGPGSPGWPPTGDNYTPGDTHDELLSYFPWCESTYIDDCSTGEIKIPCTDICWRRCPVGMEWYNGGCHGYPYFGSYQDVLNSCKQIDQRYRLPSLDEVAYLLDQCYTGTFGYYTTNYCSPYQDSAMRFVMDPPWEMFFSSWVGDLEWCIDQYGYTTQSCAWFSRMYINTILPTEFDWLYANGYAASALSSGMCIRGN